MSSFTSDASSHVVQAAVEAPAISAEEEIPPSTTSANDRRGKCWTYCCDEARRIKSKDWDEETVCPSCDKKVFVVIEEYFQPGTVNTSRTLGR